MTRRITRAGAALCFLLLLSGLSLSCASSKGAPDAIGELRAGIEENVADDARRAGMSASVDAIEHLTEDLTSLIDEERKSLAPMMRDYGVSRGDIEASLARQNDRRANLSRKMLDAHLALKAQATPAEWKKLRKLEAKALEQAAATSLGQQAMFHEEKSK